MLQTDKTSVGGKKTTNKKHGQFLFFHHPIMAGNTTWVLKESPSFSKDILASSVSTRL
jgi:hypothetical protein